MIFYFVLFPCALGACLSRPIWEQVLGIEYGINNFKICGFRKISNNLSFISLTEQQFVNNGRFEVI